MIFDPRYFPYLCNCFLALMLIYFVCAGYAYRVNARRPKDDPQKRDFHFGAVLLAPFTFPLFIAASITLFLLRVLVYGVFLILFTIALVAIRKPFLLVWLDKIATQIGNKLLAGNTALIRIFFGSG